MEADARDPEALARDRAAALALLHEWTESEALRRHAYAVEAAVRAYARLRGADEEAWGCVALLHDFDYERHPTLDQHPQDGAPFLREAGYPEWFIRAILSHAGHLQSSAKRETDLEHVLFACDELAGFVHACGLVRPEGLSTLEPRSVRKKLKQKSFASGVNRDDVTEGAEELGVDLDDHILVVIEALRPIAGELGLPG
jgi:putative nucleotidyltransferase with HDIG domain